MENELYAHISEDGRKQTLKEHLENVSIMAVWRAARHRKSGGGLSAAAVRLKEKLLPRCLRCDRVSKTERF